MSPYAGAQEWVRFLSPIAHAVANKPDRETFAGTCAACADALAIRPEWLSDIRRREAMASFKFWPSVAEISDLFDTDKRHAMSMAALRQPAPQVLPAPQPPGPAEREAIAVKADAFRAEMAERAASDSPKTTARPLAPHHLLAGYERLAAQGNTAAAYRAAQLRKEFAE
jgi:hypothetical protein